MAGGTLHDMIRQPAFVTSATGGAFPCVRALEIIRDVCKGMAYLHGKSPPTLHGDLTSSNILLRYLKKYNLFPQLRGLGPSLS